MSYNTTPLRRRTVGGRGGGGRATATEKGGGGSTAIEKGGVQPLRRGGSTAIEKGWGSSAIERGEQPRGGGGGGYSHWRRGTQPLRGGYSHWKRGYSH